MTSCNIQYINLGKLQTNDIVEAEIIKACLSFFFSTKRGRDIATNRSTVTASVKNADPTLLNVEFRENDEVTQV